MVLRGRAGVGPGTAGRAPAGTMPVPAIFAPSGPASPPAYGASGGLVQVAASTAAAVPYPAGIAAGHLLVLQTNGVGVPSATPAGWTLLGPGALSFVSGFGTRQCRTFWKFADGTEAGTLAVTSSAAGPMAACMHRLTNVKQGATAADFLEGFGERSGANPTLTHEPITSTGPQRLAVVLGFRGGDNFATNDMTGETGADLVELADVGSPVEFNYGFHLFAGVLAAAGTVSGGSAGTTGVAGGWASQAFALRAAA